MTDPHIEMGRKISAAREAFCDLPQDLTRFDRTGMVDGFDPEFKPLPVFVAVVLGCVMAGGMILAASMFIVGGL